MARLGYPRVARSDSDALPGSSRAFPNRLARRMFPMPMSQTPMRRSSLLRGSSYCCCSHSRSWRTPLAAQSLADLRTRAEATDFRETSSYDGRRWRWPRQLAELSDADSPDLASARPTKGARLPSVGGGRAPDATPEAPCRATGKTRVYLQGNIHAGEVCGKEALLMLLRDFAQRSRTRTWTEDLVLLVAPIYNADGNERDGVLRNRPAPARARSAAWARGRTLRGST